MDDSIIGTTVDGYHIQEVLGRGGMGVVYRARDVSLDRDVALKRISPKLANDEPFLRRFRSEAQALARLESPHIVSVYALRETEIGLLIVMEYVDGGTVKDLTRQGPMSWTEALLFVEQMLTGLQHAHGADVVHRDIKPQNILLTGSGTVKVTDFGLAKVYRPDSQHTVTQGVHGTLKYMSPEQVQGDADLDHRSDLYSLGMTVYEMLAGQLPFGEDESEFAIMQTIVEKDLPPPGRYRPAIPDAFSSVVMQSLAKAPEDRFENTSAMRAAFEAAANQQEEATEATTADVVQAAGIGTGGLSRVRVAGVGLLIAMMAIGGYLMYAMMIDDGEVGAGSSRAGRPGASTTALSIETTPEGATVYHEGRRVGVTPLDYKVDDDSAEFRMDKAGFLPVDTALGLIGGQTVDLDVRLQSEPAETNLLVSTVPSGAVVFVNGDSAGVTPVSTGAMGASAHVRIQKAGYAPLDTVTSLEGNSPVALELELSAVNADTASAPRGTVDLAVRPAGSVIVDGKRHEGGARIKLPVGRHRVRFQHPEYGEKDTTLTVEEGQTEAVTLYFEHPIRVRAPDQVGMVALGGTNTGVRPPHKVLRGPGTYRVGLQLGDDHPQTVTGGEYWKTVDGRELASEQFSATESVVTITPSFRPETHVVSFRVTSLVEQVRGRVDELTEAMKRAIEEERWDLLPEPLATSCREALEALYAKHEITSVRVVANEVQLIDGRVELPFETYITYRQRGRVGTKYIPLSIVTVWGPREGDVHLVDVRRTKVGDT